MRDEVLKDKTIDDMAVGIAAVVTPDGKRVYVARGNAEPPAGRDRSKDWSIVSVIDPTLKAGPIVLRSRRFKAGIHSIAMTRQGRYVLIGNGSRVSVIDTETDDLLPIKTIYLRSSPAGIAISQRGEVYITLFERGIVHVYDLRRLLTSPLL
jgi:DNA-binding beta-propeller fold protein YncE